MALVSEGNDIPQATPEAVADGTVHAPNGEIFHGASLTSLAPGADGKVHVPDADFLYDASFIRSGSDLKLVGDDGHTIVVPGYFDSDTPAPLVAPNGTGLSGSTVSLLAGPAHPGQYAQIASPSTTDATGAAQPIGKVVEAEGTLISVKHTDGTAGSLKVGDPIFEKDVVDAGGPLGIRFNDGTVFTMTAGTRMVIDHLVYDPDGSSNSALFSVLKGTFAMVGGNIVHTGDMKVATPIATLGIRGSNSYGFNVDAAKGWLTTKKHDPDGSLSKVDVLVPEGQPLLKKIAFDDATEWVTFITLEGELVKITKHGPDGPVTAELMSGADVRDLEALARELVRAVNEDDEPETAVLLTANQFEIPSGDVFVLQLTEVEGHWVLVLPPAFVKWLEDHTEFVEPTILPIVQVIINNPPVITVDGVPPAGDSASATVAEDLTVAGTLTVTDADVADTVTASVTSVAPSGTPGGLTDTDVLNMLTVSGLTDTDLLNMLTVTAGSIAADPGDANNLAWNFDSGAFDFLAAGETLVLTYTIQATDGIFATEQLITITIQGTNDAPVIVGEVFTDSVTELGSNVDDGSLTANGTFTFDDADLTDTHTVSFTPVSTTLGTLTGSITDPATGTGDGTVAWTYTVDAAAVADLAYGETKVEQFTVTVTDVNGAPLSDTATVQVTIQGTNDAPVIVGEVFTDSVTELGSNVDDGSLTANGTFTFDDADLTDTHTVSFTPVSTTLGTLTGSITDPATGTGDGTVAWTYTVDAAAVADLAYGETKVEQFTVTVTDVNGAPLSDTATVQVTIQGTNDAPVIVGEVFTDSVTELGSNVDDGSLTANGTFTFDDADLTDTHTVSFTPVSTTLGTLTGSITDPATGTGDGTVAWTYTVDAAAVADLAYGETKVEQFTVTVTDVNGAPLSDTATVQVTIQGTNDAPVIVGEVFTDSVTELGSNVDDGSLTANGTFTFDDADLTDTHTVSFTPVSTTLGTLTGSITDPATGTGDGTVAWTYTVDAAAVADLAYGETKVEQFTVTVTDVNGAPLSDTATVQVTIQGTNDAPVIVGEVFTDSVTELGSNVDDGSLTANGTFTFDDADLTDTHTVSFTPVSTTLGTLTGSITDPATGTGDGTVAWTYTVDAAAVADLAYGETKVEQFTVTVTDVNGAPLSDTATVQVTIQGTNDAPVIVGEVFTDSVTELGSNVDDGSLTANGTFTFDDADLTDTHTVSFTPVSTTLGTLTGSITDPATGTGDGTVAWTYTVDAAAVADLAYGETKVEQFTVTVTDVNGAPLSDTATVQVTIQGTNDAPVIVGEVFTDSVTELGSNVDDGSLTANGTFTFDDADLTDTHTVSFTPVSTTLGTLTGSITDPATGTGDGTVAWTYTVDAAAVADLAYGETKVEQFTVTVTDVNGAPLSDTATVQVTIQGTNDAPVIVGEVFTDSVTELGSNVDDGSLTANGTFTFDDADLTDTHTVSFTPVSTTLGTLTGSITDPATGTGDGTVAWTYTVDAAAVADLAYGETKVEQFTVTVTDVNGAPLSDTATVQVTIQGTNDAPVIVGEVFTDSVTELGSNVDDGSLTANGTFTFDDADLTDTHTVSFTPVSTTLGTLTGSITDPATGTGDGTVAWTYTVDAAAVADLAYGETKVEQFTVTVTDVNGAPLSDTATVQVTIQGTNDAPVIVGEVFTDSVTELGSNVDDGSLTANGTFTFDDADLTDTHTVSFTPVSTTLGTLTGSITDPATGTGDGTVAWTYTVDAAAVADLAYGETKVEQFTVTVTDVNGAPLSDTATVQVTIQGTNDAPVIVGEVFTDSVTELGSNVDDGSLTANGTFTFDDADLTDTHTVSFTPVSTTLGTLTGSITDPATGTGDGTVAWTYTVDAAAVADLAYGETKVEQFTVTVTDVNGAPLSDTATVQVTIQGTNDAPVIVGEVFTDSVTELGSNVDDGSLTANGTFTFDDADLTDTHTVSFTPVSTTLGTLTGSITDPATGTGDGTVAWTYTVDAAAVADLAYGETKVEQFTVTVTDVNGAPLSDTATVQVTIQGTNDAPVISLVTTDSASATLPETDSGLSASGTLTITDADLTDTVSTTVTGVSHTGPTGVLTDAQLQTFLTVAPPSGLAADPGAAHNLTWTFNSGTQAFDFLAAGQQLVLNYTVQTADGHGGIDTQTVTVTITGTDDNSPITLIVDSPQDQGNNLEFEFSATLVVPGTESGDFTYTFSNGQTTFDVVRLDAEGQPVIGSNGEPETIQLQIVGDKIVSPKPNDNIQNYDYQFTIVATGTGGLVGTTYTETFNIITSGTNNDADSPLEGTAADDVLYGANESDVIRGFEGDDNIFGQADADTTLDGGDGNDRLTGGDAHDTLTGGSGSDTFIWGPVKFEPLNSANADTITDYNFLEGDKIDLQTLVPSLNNPGDDPSNYVRVVKSGNDLLVQVDTTGLGQDENFITAYTLSGADTNAVDSVYVFFNGQTYVITETTLLAGTATVTTAVDPIVLDLGDPGIELSSTASFDLNADGQLDNVAWTDGQDGILVMDLDKSGFIENGTEVFSPDFGQGGYADALDALASLDSNGDGVIDSADQAFADLRVWQDQSRDGVSDTGELKSLADLGITGIDLNAITSSGTIDGQQLLAEGTFTYANGQTGDYIMVALGQPSADGTANTAIKLDYSRETGNRGVMVNLSNSSVQADIGYGIATAAAMTALDTFGNEQALAADVQEVTGTNQADALIAGATGVTFDTLDGNDNLRGSAEADILNGGAGDDQITGGGGADAIDGGSGIDTVYFGDSTSGISINLDDAGDASTTPASSTSPADGEIGGGFAEDNDLSGIENISGSSHDDVLVGNASANVLDGGAGNDVLRGEGGDDTLLGGEGNDTLDGGEGNDTLSGGLGDDTLIGGQGNDTIDGGDGTDTVDYSQDGGPHGVIVNLSDQSFKLADHPFIPDVGYEGEAVAAMTAIDTFGDIDILSGIDNIIGSGIDNIIGTQFDDVLIGPGNGVKLTGGDGADTFVLTGTVADLIADFNQSEGDTIDLTALYHEFTAANGALSASEFIDEHVQYDQKTGTLSVDMDGDSVNGYEQVVAMVNEASTSASSSVWLHDGISSDSSLDSSAAQAPASVTVVVEDQSATTAIA